MKFKTFIIGYVFALALFLFAQRRPDAAPPVGFRGVIDLTHTVNANLPTYDAAESGAYQAKMAATIEKNRYFARNVSLPEHFGTHIDAPAHFAPGGWTVDQIPGERLVASLVVIAISDKVQNNPDYQLSVQDIARWEEVNGQIPPGALVMANTGWESRWNQVGRFRNADARGMMHFPGFSLEAAKFLVEARGVIGFGIDTLSIDYGPSKNFEVHQYSLGRGLYHLENVANLDRTPPTGAMAVVAPMKLAGGSGGPVRILALVR